MMLARLSGARRYLEIGTFTGYSTPGYGLGAALRWKRRGLRARAPLHRDSSPSLGASRGRGRDRRADRARDRNAGVAAADPFDIAFIDADKENLLAYYERVLSLIRPGGLVLIDNTLWNGSVATREMAPPRPARYESSIAGCTMTSGSKRSWFRSATALRSRARPRSVSSAPGTGWAWFAVATCEPPPYLSSVPQREIWPKDAAETATSSETRCGSVSRSRWPRLSIAAPPAQWTTCIPPCPHARRGSISASRHDIAG